jgi:hypothetical protein
MTKPITDPLVKGNKPAKATAEAAVKEKNYSEADEALLNFQYLAAPTRETVDNLAEALGKSPRSIIAKLSSMKIYVTPPRTTKSGKAIIKKETLVERINALLEIDAPSLVKANKLDLEKMLKAVEDWTGYYDPVCVE